MSTEAPQEERDALLATMLHHGQIREQLQADPQLNAIVGTRRNEDSTREEEPVQPRQPTGGTIGLSDLFGVSNQGGIRAPVSSVPSGNNNAAGSATNSTSSGSVYRSD
eukprot:SAG31_NODE_1773_length_7304_cov_2.180380_3_plen_108_part_00